LTTGAFSELLHDNGVAHFLTGGPEGFGLKTPRRTVFFEFGCENGERYD
jgi:hypothetical protein